MRSLVAAVALVQALVVLGLPAESAADNAGTVASGSPVGRAIAVLHDWDAHRARAWAGSDELALLDLYTARSPAGRADARLLRAYTARGLVVRRIETQVFAVRVLHATDRAVTLRVFDRVAGGEVLSPDDTLPLPSTRPVTRLVRFQRGNGAWQVAGVRAVNGTG